MFVSRKYIYEIFFFFYYYYYVLLVVLLLAPNLLPETPETRSGYGANWSGREFPNKYPTKASSLLRP